MPSLPPVVAFDCGETLFDETGQWTVWASWLGVPPFTLMVTLGAMLERGRPFKEVFSLFNPAFDIDAEIRRRHLNGTAFAISERDLHADVRPALTTLSAAGLRLVIAGTMTEAERAEITGLGLPVEEIVPHTHLGQRNADPAFFPALAEHLDTTTDSLLYVSHRLDTAKAAADRAGTAFVYLVRGPIARLRLGTPADVDARDRIDSLLDLVDRVR